MQSRGARPTAMFVFDWDNTLVDTHEKGLECSLRAVRAAGVTISAEDFRRCYVPDYHAVYRALGIAEHRFDEVDDAWLRYYGGEVPTRCFDDVRPVLDALSSRGHRLALVTTGQRSRVHRELGQLGLDGRFARVVCREDVSLVKPAPDAVFLLRESFPEVERFTLVGDHPDDVEMARRGGIQGVLLRRGGAAGAGEIASLRELLALMPGRAAQQEGAI